MGGPRRWSLHPDTSTNEHWLRPATEASAPDTVRPLAPSRYHLHVTMDAEAHAALRKLQDLLHPEVPNGDPALIVGRALTLLLRHVERRKFAAKAAGGAAGRNVTPLSANAEREASPDASPTTGTVNPPSDAASRALCAPTTGARYIPAAIRRTVWERDEGRCTFVGPGGRCPERGGLEFHHREPLGRGGPTTVDNVAIFCRSHNQWQADLDYGEAQMEALRDRSSRLHGAIDAHGRGQARGLLEHRLSGGDRRGLRASPVPRQIANSVQTELAEAARAST